MSAFRKNEKGEGKYNQMFPWKRKAKLANFSPVSAKLKIVRPTIVRTFWKRRMYQHSTLSFETMSFVFPTKPTTFRSIHFDTTVEKQ